MHPEAKTFQKTQVLHDDFAQHKQHNIMHVSGLGPSWIDNSIISPTYKMIWSSSKATLKGVEVQTIEKPLVLYSEIGQQKLGDSLCEQPRAELDQNSIIP